MNEIGKEKMRGEDEEGCPNFAQQTNAGSGLKAALHPNGQSPGGSACVSVPSSYVSTPFGRALRLTPRHSGGL